MWRRGRKQRIRPEHNSGRGHEHARVVGRLEISEKTVKAHLTQVFAQLGVSDRTQAALWLERNGLPEPI